jgi:hypothetical protein
MPSHGRHRKTWPAVDLGDESEFNAIDIEFFVVKKGVHPRITHIITLFVDREFLTMGSSASPIVVVVLIVGPKLFIEPGTKAFFLLSSVSGPGL